MGAPVIRPLRAGEEAAAASVLSEAMLTNPIHVAVLQGDGPPQQERLRRMFSEMLVAVPGRVRVAAHDEELLGVLRSYSCPKPGTGRDDRSDPGESEAEARIAHWLAEWDRRDPEEPHRHLGPVGVLPHRQGSGIGSLLMDEFCASLGGEPAYLETDKAANVSFYGRFGFEVVGSVDIFGVRNTFMWAPARDP